ncbi:LytTR family transcriptional regulator DNA-binding domain-containing protein [Blautia schinkii]|nr:LytTR family transcriptional regulator DNA-binding domain-containing protein [Blautia schinkii]
MKVNEYQRKDILEDRIDFYYRMKTKEVNEILDFLMKHRKRLVGKVNDKEIIFSLNDVYYFESVDKKTFAYLDDQVVRIDIRLQDLENAYYELGFIRVNKSTILNVYKINSLKSEINMRVMALLDNGERIQINRSYKAKFNSFLNAMKEGVFQNETGK